MGSRAPRGRVHLAASLLFLAALLAIILLRLGPLAPGTRVHCDLVAAHDGSDAGTGSGVRPFRTVGRLVRALREGETGCLRSGVYREDVTIRHGGSARHPIVLRSYPGERATVRGRLYVARGADHTRIAYLNLDGRSTTRACAPFPCPSPTVNADDTSFAHDDVTNAHTAICFDIGSERYGIAHDTLITHNRIHDCGVLPANNHEHGIYLADSRDARVTFNVIEDNADRGIQLYPQADRTTIENNVIAGNGQGIDFSGLGDVASDDNVVSHNVIINSRRGYNVTSFYSPNDPVGNGNVVVQNCIGGGVRATSLRPAAIDVQIGFQAHDNVMLPSERSGRARLPSTGGEYSLCTHILSGVGLTPGRFGL